MPPLRMTVGDAFMRPWVFTRPLPNCGQGGMNAAPAGARRERIHAPLGICASVTHLRQGRHECRPLQVTVGGAFMRPWFIHRPFAARAA